ncbi:hypothetical protein BH11ARM2_BH11ARM2_34040 [soil metagenome]
MARFGRMPAYLSAGALLAVGATQYVSHQKAAHEESVAVYDIKWEKPTGWNVMPHSPQSLFLFRDPHTNLLIRGASNQIIADSNPTPELDSEGLADYYLATTQQNMPGWTAEKIAGDEGQGVKFALLRRQRDDKTVVTAFGVRGNTTLVVTLSGNGKEQKEIAATESAFREGLHHISLKRAKVELDTDGPL